MAGRRGSAACSGEADIRAGRAMVGLRLAMLDGDKLAARLDAEPDRDRFDLDVRAIAPRDGLLPAMVGLKRPIDLSIEGDGSWTRWRGAARLLVERREAADLALAADSGRYRLDGFLAPAPFLKGKLQRLTAPTSRSRAERPSRTGSRRPAGAGLAVASRGRPRRASISPRAATTRSALASTCFGRRRCSPT